MTSARVLAVPSPSQTGSELHILSAARYRDSGGLVVVSQILTSHHSCGLCYLGHGSWAKRTWETVLQRNGFGCCRHKLPPERGKKHEEGLFVSTRPPRDTGNSRGWPLQRRRPLISFPTCSGLTQPHPPSAVSRCPRSSKEAPAGWNRPHAE